MSKLKNTVVVTGVITPGDTKDEFAVIDPKWGIDGMRSCADEAEMFAITKKRRRKGMLVSLPAFQEDGITPEVNPNGYQTFIIYQLVNNPASGPTTIDDWEPWVAGGGDDKHYTHTQASPSVYWRFVHGLGKKCSVVVTTMNEPDVICIPAVRYIDENEVEVWVGKNPVMGYAYCN